MAAEIPTSTEVLLKSDASKQFLDNLIGQGWDSWNPSVYRSPGNWLSGLSRTDGC